MFKRVSEALNKKVSYVKELHTRFFYFDDIQYLLKDDDGKEYLLVLCFDDNERQDGYIWTSKVDRLMYRLYNYPLKKMHKVKNKVIKYNIVCEDISESSYRDEFSLNRFEIIYPNNKNYVLKYDNEALMLSIDNDKAIVGTWNNYTRRSTFLAMINYVFNSFKDVKTVEYNNQIYDNQFDNKHWRHPDYYLPLPNSIEDLKIKISSKGRHNIKREKRIIVDEFGSLELINNKYDEDDVDVVNLFYKYKNDTHDLSEDYDIKNRHLTDYYLLKCGNDIKGVLLSCEQSNIAFIENHTFDSSMRQYSFGQVMYDMYLDSLINKGKTGLSLAGGNLAYKKRYGSICFVSFSGTINKTAFKKYRILRFFKYSVNGFIYKKYSALITLMRNQIN